LSFGPGSYSWAYAFSNDGFGDAAYAFAMASAGRGGMGAIQVAGVADPFAGNSIGIPLDNPSNPSGFPTTDPSTDPWSVPYTDSATGMTFSGSGSELNGDDEIQAFVYNGTLSPSGLEAELGATSSSGTSSSGDVTSLSTLESDFNLIPLDAPIDDPSSISSLTFTENTSMILPNDTNVVLVGMEEAQSTPEPSATWLLGIGVAGLLILRKFRTAKVA
jgi:hypothetical protein